MFNQGFTVSGSSLKLMGIGERGIVAGFSHSNDAIKGKLRSLGLIPGTAITLEQRFPRFIVKAGFNRIALDEQMIRAVYVRLVDHHTGLLSREQRHR
jgi:ferrous iron transport protein A